MVVKVQMLLNPYRHLTAVAALATASLAAGPSVAESQADRPELVLQMRVRGLNPVMAMSSDERLVATASGPLILIQETQTGRVLRQLSVVGNVTRLAFESQQARLVAVTKSGDQTAVHVYDVLSRALQQVATRANSTVCRIDFPKPGQASVLFQFSDSRSVRVDVGDIDLVDSKFRQRSSVRNELCRNVVPDPLAAGDYLQILSKEDNALFSTIPGAGRAERRIVPRTAAWNKLKRDLDDIKLLGSSLQTGTLLLVNRKDGWIDRLDALTGELKQTLPLPGYLARSVTDCSLLNDARFLVCAQLLDKRTTIVEVSTGRVIGRATAAINTEQMAIRDDGSSLLHFDEVVRRLPLVQAGAQAHRKLEAPSSAYIAFPSVDRYVWVAEDGTLQARSISKVGLRWSRKPSARIETWGECAGSEACLYAQERDALTLVRAEDGKAFKTVALPPGVEVLQARADGDILFRRRDDLSLHTIDHRGARASVLPANRFSSRIAIDEQRRFIAELMNGTVQLTSLTTGARIWSRPLFNQSGRPVLLAFLSKGEAVLAAVEGSTPTVLRVADGRPLSSLGVRSSTLQRPVFDRGGNWAAFHDGDCAELLDTATWGSRMFECAWGDGLMPLFGGNASELVLVKNKKEDLRVPLDPSGPQASFDKKSFRSFLVALSRSHLVYGSMDESTLVSVELATNETHVIECEQPNRAVASRVLNRIAYVDRRGNVRVRDLDSLAEVEFELPRRSSKDAVRLLAFGDQARQLVLVTQSNEVWRLDIASATKHKVLIDVTHDDSVQLVESSDKMPFVLETRSRIAYLDLKSGQVTERALREPAAKGEEVRVAAATGAAAHARRQPDSPGGWQVDLHSSNEVLLLRPAADVQFPRVSFGLAPGMSFSEDGSLLVVQWQHQHAEVYHTTTGQRVAKLRDIGSLEIRPRHWRGKSFLAIESDGRLRVVNAETGARSAPWMTSSPAASFAWSLDRRHAVVDMGTRWALMDTTGVLAEFVTLGDGRWAAVDDTGRFDTNDFEPAAAALHWVFPDDPLKAAPLDLYLHAYFQPGLLDRVLNGKPLPEVLPVSKATAPRPRVGFESVVLRAGDTADVTLRVDVERSKDGTPAKVENLTLLRNGQEVRRIAVPSLPNGEEAQVSFAGVRLPGGFAPVEFTAYAFSRDGVRGDRAHHVLNKLEPTTTSRKAHVLAVGTDEYSDPSLALKHAANDANAMVAALLPSLRESGRFVQVEAQTLTATALNPLGANKRDIEQAVLARGALSPEPLRLGPDDLLILYFSGHGLLRSDGSFHLLTAEASSNNLSAAAQNPDATISDIELASWVSSIDAGQIVLILDSCFSSAAIQSADFKPAPLNSRSLGQLAFNKKMFVLAAAQPQEVALESNALRHGLLTHALVNDGLKAGHADLRPTDGRLTLAELLDYAVQRVPQLRRQVEGRTRAPVLADEQHDSDRPAASSTQRPGKFDFSGRSLEEVVLLPRP